MKIAIYGRVTSGTDFQNLASFFTYMHSQNINCSIYATYAEELKANDFLQEALEKFPERYTSFEQIQDVNFIYSLGGDGTLLDALRFSGTSQKPLVGINFGRLGFLTTGQQPDIISITAALKDGNYSVDKRTLLEVNSSSDQLFNGVNFALNDLTIHKANTNEMITVHTYINGEYLNSYWTDGLIVSTPTGSTAYSLACGGPIMMPGSDVVVLTPIAPHSLTVRPFIIPDDAVISFEIESRSGQAFVALDSRTVNVDSRIEIAVKKSAAKAHLVNVDSPSYFQTLRRRLNWGLDARN